MTTREITKLKNGNIELRLDKEHGWYFDREGKLTEEYYHDVMTMEDLYINQVLGYLYLIDFNTRRVYPMEFNYGTESLGKLLDLIQREYERVGVYTMEPCTKEMAEEVLHDLENDY